MKDAPYLLEPLAEGFAEEAVPVKLALLAAVTKLFFRRPPECQKLLGSVLAAASSDANQDVHDRALLYYRCCTEVLLPCLLTLLVLCGALGHKIWRQLSASDKSFLLQCPSLCPLFVAG